MTALERAARAAEQELGKVELVLTDPVTLRRMQAKRVARAVLMAVRELSSEILEEHLYDNEYGYAMYYEGWQPAIDAILNEKE